jgi:hypothetical protein
MNYAAAAMIECQDDSTLEKFVVDAGGENEMRLYRTGGTCTAHLRHMEKYDD